MTDENDKIDKETQNENEVTALSLFEQVNKELVVSRGVEVPLSYVFGRGLTANEKSFGGKNFAENAMRTDLALKNVGELEDIWNHSHSQWMWKHLNLSYHSPYNNMRQISAEITSKRNALSAAKWQQIESELEYHKLEDELLNSKDLDHWREIELKVKLARIKEGINCGITYIEGAMKDVLTLNALFEQLKSRVSNFSEADIEREETKNHLKRSLVQSIRDVRMSGCITKAEQEYLEHIGVNPMKIQNLLRAYVEQEAKEEDWDISGLYRFVDELTDDLIEKCQVDKIRMEMQGFSSEYVDHFGHSDKVAILKEESKEEKK